MQRDKNDQNCYDQFTNVNHFESDPLLLLQSRQIVHHMLIVEDWIILSIETPHQKTTKKNFQKLKQPPQQSSQKHQSQAMRSITRLVSVMAIKTEDKNIVNFSKQSLSLKKTKKINSAHLLQSPQCKSSIGEIKMLHKQCRLQNILPWTIPEMSQNNNSSLLVNNENNYQANSNNKNISVFTAKDKHSTINNFNNNSQQQQKESDTFLKETIKQFVLLTYTRIQLYSIQYLSNISSIKLVRIFQTPFLIPFNILWLKNQKLTSTTQKYPNRSRQKSHLSAQIKFKSHKNQQPFQIALSGIDRSQTFWSGYYEIENHKRNIYLLRNFAICPKQNIQHIKVSKNLKSPQKNLRRVRSAENIFNFRSPFKGQKNKLTSTQHFTKESFTFDNQSTTFQNKFQPSLKQDLNKKLLQFKQTLPNEFMSRIQSKNSAKKQQKGQKMIPKQLQYDEKVQINPKLLVQNNKSPYHHNYSKHNLSPPLQFYSHFYLQVVSHNNNNSSSLTSQNKTVITHGQKFKKHFELMLIVSYHNSIALINIQRKQMISKVQLQPMIQIMQMIKIQSVFGIHSVILLTKKNGQNINKKLPSLKNKLIKLTVDGISWDKLGIGLEKVRVPGLIVNNKKQLEKHQKQQQHQKHQQNEQTIIKLDNIWQQSLLQQINKLINEHQMFVTQSHSIVNYQQQQQYQIDKDLINKQIVCQQQQQYQQNTNQHKQKDDNIINNNNNNNNYDDQLSFFITQLQQWRNIPITEMKYNLLVVTSYGRMLLYNHIRNTIKQIYSPVGYYINNHQNHIQHNNNNTVSLSCTNKLYIHYGQSGNNNNDIQNQQQFIPSLRMKLAVIFNKQVIPESIKHYSSYKNKPKRQQIQQKQLSPNSNKINYNNKPTTNTNQTSNKHTLPIAHLKQLKQIILLNSR